MKINHKIRSFEIKHEVNLVFEVCGFNAIWVCYIGGKDYAFFSDMMFGEGETIKEAFKAFKIKYVNEKGQ